MSTAVGTPAKNLTPKTSSTGPGGVNSSNKVGYEASGKEWMEGNRNVVMIGREA